MSKRSYSQFADPFGSRGRLSYYESQLRSRPRGVARSAGRSIKGSYSAAKGASKSFRVRAPPALKKVVKAIIASEKEQKVEIGAIYGGGITSLVATDNITAPTFNPLAPQLQTGTGGEDGRRIGEEVQMTKSYLKYTLGLPLDSGPVSPYIVTVWIGKIRGEANRLPLQADYDELLLAAGGGPVGPDTGFRVSNSYPVNDDYWDIKVRKVYKLGKASRSDSTTNPVANNDFNLIYQDEIDITRFLKNKLVYDGNGNSYPMNDGLYLWVTFTTIDDSDPTGTLPNISGCVVHRFTDA